MELPLRRIWAEVHDEMYDEVYGATPRATPAPSIDTNTKATDTSASATATDPPPGNKLQPTAAISMMLSTHFTVSALWVKGLCSSYRSMLYQGICSKHGDVKSTEARKETVAWEASRRKNTNTDDG